MVTLIGGNADGLTVDATRVRGSHLWVTVLDGRAHVLDMSDPLGARNLLTDAAAPGPGGAGPAGWDEYERDGDGGARFVEHVTQRRR